MVEQRSKTLTNMFCKHCGTNLNSFGPINKIKQFIESAFQGLAEGKSMSKSALFRRAELAFRCSNGEFEDAWSDWFQDNLIEQIGNTDHFHWVR